MLCSTNKEVYNICLLLFYLFYLFCKKGNATSNAEKMNQVVKAINKLLFITVEVRGEKREINLLL